MFDKWKCSLEIKRMQNSRKLTCFIQTIFTFIPCLCLPLSLRRCRSRCAPHYRAHFNLCSSLIRERFSCENTWNRMGGCSALGTRPLVIYAAFFIYVPMSLASLWNNTVMLIHLQSREKVWQRESGGRDSAPTNVGRQNASTHLQEILKLLKLY